MEFERFVIPEWVEQRLKMIEEWRVRNGKPPKYMKTVYKDGRLFVKSQDANLVECTEEGFKESDIPLDSFTEEDEITFKLMVNDLIDNYLKVSIFSPDKFTDCYEYFRNASGVYYIPYKDGRGNIKKVFVFVRTGRGNDIILGKSVDCRIKSDTLRYSTKEKVFFKPL